MKRNKYIFMCFLLLCSPFVFGSEIYENITPEKFKEERNIFGAWQIIGFQYEWGIGNAPKENVIKKDMGGKIELQKKYFKYLSEKAMEFNKNIKLSHNSCMRPNEGLFLFCEEEDLNNKMNASTMIMGKIREEINLNIVTQEPERRRYPNYNRIWGMTMFIFDDNTYNVMAQTDGGYYILRKLTKQGVKSINKIHKTSFICDEKTWTDVERLICTNKQLADADLQLSKVYAKALENANPEQAKEIKATQRKWLKEQMNTVDIINLENLYKERIDELLSYQNN